MEKIITMGDYERAERERLTLFESRAEFDRAFIDAFGMTEEQFKTLQEEGYVNVH